MASRCSKGTIHISRRLALQLLNWHGGQGDPIYAVGSTAMNRGACLPAKLVFDAAYNLRLSVKQETTPNSRGRYYNPKRVRDQLVRLAETMTKKGAAYEGED